MKNEFTSGFPSIITSLIACNSMVRTWLPAMQISPLLSRPGTMRSSTMTTTTLVSLERPVRFSPDHNYIIVSGALLSPFVQTQSSVFALSGHFTQVVWAATTTVGCAVKSCPKYPIYICEYDPPGNVIYNGGNSLFVKNVLP